MESGAQTNVANGTNNNNIYVSETVYKENKSNSRKADKEEQPVYENFAMQDRGERDKRPKKEKDKRNTKDAETGVEYATVDKSKKKNKDGIRGKGNKGVKAIDDETVIQENGELYENVPSMKKKAGRASSPN